MPTAPPATPDPAPACPAHGPGRQPHRSRLLLRELDRFPDLAAKMPDKEIQRMHHPATRWLATRWLAAQWLAAQANPKEPKRDWPALAAVLAGVISISWLLCNGFGQRPAGIDQDRDIAARVQLAAGVLDADADQPQAISASTKQP